jgi:adenine-specific DNA-methyltransferase
MRWGFDASEKRYVVETNPKVVQRCILMTTDPGDLVLDPTCGSGTTAYVAEQWGRRWITIDTSRVALALARTRLMSAKYPYYLLQDSPEGQAKTAELKAQPVATQPTHNNIKKGFVYRTVPHIKLQLIANNEEIDEIYERWQQKLEPIRAQINNVIGQTWEDWEIPRDPDNHWDDATRELHQQWWKHRRDRQTEIDASIARRADQETLYDQPYEDKKRIRVSGRFTVESLAPYRVLNPDSDRPNSERAGTRDAHDQFESRIIENLLTAGVQNTKKGERLIFETLELSIAGESGEYIHAIGQYTDSNDQTHEVAVHIGPEYGTVSRQDIRKASRDAARLDNVDTLIVCGFAFEAKISEDTHQIGKLTVLTARMHGDLLLGDQLKKTKSANLFTVFGEPDIELKQDGDRCTIELKGLDIYDPTTGAIRSSSTEDIAAWFIDTRYNEENFVVRHAYFTGANKPYEKLQKTLKAEIDPDAWSVLYSDVSRSFPKPDTGKIAVKVINHYGDEVLKILSVN